MTIFKPTKEAHKILGVPCM